MNVLAQAIEQIKSYSCGCNPVCQCNGETALRIRLDVIGDILEEALEKHERTNPPVGFQYRSISSEIKRTYVYPDGKEYTIVQPVTLYISDSGGHRVTDRDGFVHAPTRGWIAIKWVPSDIANPIQF
ncbi:hypothetical protein Ab1vBOLIVR5_gp85c [Agrobacterium phage OLIVR5]|uniref:Uncharacterized protein n=2 Tax=Caudoviricetes TaxID=2731619 RepID=A0A858MT80_9CAUD|nr:hypothetical protein KNU99_gp085 [Agrobacterium phage OLIVR5]QIW87733.1 hypothetical protein Ab1vBOLIVR5_gp85c [Agrobacterium phage OLIVR5]QIW87995.1 hypothetical protein Ab1vBOLIVR6_gp88c [Agrobacterium phage OLIVR6]